MGFAPESQFRSRLLAGGEWIRTISSASNSQPFRGFVGDRADQPSARWCTRAVAGLDKPIDSGMKRLVGTQSRRDVHSSLSTIAVAPAALAPHLSVYRALGPSATRE